MSAAEVRPQIRAPSARGPLQLIYLLPEASLFLVHLLEFLITHKELIWDSLSSGMVPAGHCPGCLSNGSDFLHPTVICKQPDTKERLGVSFAGIVGLGQDGGD